MTTYIIKRLLISIPVLFGILLVTFVLARLIPGDPCKAILGEKATVEVCEKFEKRFGLDQPIHTQFFLYSKRVVVADFGNSIRFSRPVSQILVERFPVTIELALGGLVVAIFAGVFLGIISALKHNTSVDVGTMVLANVGISGLSSIPFFEVWGWEVLKGTSKSKFLEFFANHYIFNALITGNWEIFKDAIRHMILPVIALSTIPMAIIARITRSSLLEVLGRDYIRTAKAKGVKSKNVVSKHALRNAMLPVVTILGLQMGGLLSGAVLTETVFGLSGVGRMLVEAIYARDYPIIQAFTVMIAVAYMFINLLVDISYGFLDPRVRLE